MLISFHILITPINGVDAGLQKELNMAGNIYVKLGQIFGKLNKMEATLDTLNKETGKMRRRIG